jgi:hypothetical protein
MCTSALSRSAVFEFLEPELGPNVKQWLREDDFTHDGSGNGRVDELEIKVHLRDLDRDAQARLCTCLSPKEGAGTAKLRLKATVDRGAGLV